MPDELCALMVCLEVPGMAGAVSWLTISRFYYLLDSMVCFEVPGCGWDCELVDYKSLVLCTRFLFVFG